MNHKRMLYEDQDIIVCHKAAGIATQTSRVGQADMVSEITNYLVHTGDEKRQRMPYVGVVHRLDQPVEGILVFAKNRNAAAKLSRQIVEEETGKYYYAIVCGRNFHKEGKLENYLLKDGRTNLSSVVPPEVKGARRAVLDYEVLAEQAAAPDTGRKADEEAGETGTDGYKIALVRIRLYTGRHHQIRVQMSYAGMSLIGDRKYGDREAIRLSEQMRVREIALCAYRLSFLHPGTGKRMEFQIRPEGRSFQKAEFTACYE